MKRLLLAVLCASLAQGAFAFHDTHKKTRVGLVRPDYTDEREERVSESVLRYLADELRARGFDAVPVNVSIDEIVRDDRADADYYVEVRGGEDDANDYGAIGVGGQHVGVQLGVLVNRVAAELRVYDGATMRLLVTHRLDRKSTMVVPTSIGVGGADFYGVIAMPFIQWARARSVAHSAAKDAAVLVTSAIRPE